MLVTALEILPPLPVFGIRLNRTIISSLSYDIAFPSSVLVIASIVVQRGQGGGGILPPPSFAAAIIAQTVNTPFNQPPGNVFNPSLPWGVIKLETVVPCPYQLNTSIFFFV